MKEMVKEDQAMSETMSLYEALAKVPDPRQASGKRHPLPAVLTLMCVAMLSGARSLYAIAQFGRDRGRAFAESLGFTHEQSIGCTMLHYLLIDLDRGAFEAAIKQWTAGQARAGWTTVSIDGKTLRGTTGVKLPGVHVLAAYAHEARLVLDQIPVDASTNEHKAALELLKLIPLKDKVILGDAMFCQRDLSRQINRKKGDWVWPVKDNQPELKAAIELAFDDAGASPSGQEARRR
jgi:hypothetical protein